MTNKTTSIIKLSQNEINIVSGNRFSFTMAQFVIMGTLLAGVGLTGNGTASIKKVLYGGFATGIGFGYAQSDDFNPQDLMKKIVGGIITASLKELYDKCSGDPAAEALFGATAIFLFY